MLQNLLLRMVVQSTNMDRNCAQENLDIRMSPTHMRLKQQKALQNLPAGNADDGAAGSGQPAGIGAAESLQPAPLLPTKRTASFEDPAAPEKLAQNGKQADENDKAAMTLEDFEEQNYSKLQERKCAKAKGSAKSKAKAAPKKVLKRPAAASKPQLSKVKLGCKKCRGSRNGCVQCRSPLYSGDRMTRSEWREWFEGQKK